jgi:type I restriction enzyme S subunit
METSYLTKKLSDVCDFKVEKNTRNLPYLGMEDIQSNSMTFTGSREPKKVKSTTNYFDETTVIYGKLRPYLNKVFVPGFEGHCTTEFVPLNPNLEYLSRDWLAYWLSSSSVIEELSGNTTGSRMPRADMKRLASMEIPLPPLAEQKKIVKVLEEKLGKVKEAIQLRQDAIADTEKILSSKLSEIFTEGKEEGWKEKRIDEISDIKGGKRLPKGEKLTDESTPHPYIRVTDFKGGQLKEDTIKYLSEEIFDQISRYTISSNDIFVSIAGTVGLVHKIPKQYDGASLTENAAKITNIDHSVRKDYLYWLLNSDWIQNELKGRSIQTTISKLALYKIGEQKIVYPDLKTQERIVKELDELRARVAELHALQDDQLADLKSLERAYLHEAFNGELA